MFAVAVLLWVVVYVPNWGTQKEEQKQRSSFGRKFSKNRSVNVKKTSDGVSDLAIRNKNIRVFRMIFMLVLLAAVSGIVYGIVSSVSNPMSLSISAIALGVLTLAVSVLRSSGKKSQRRPQLTEADREAQRRRMAYLIRESALIDAKPDELFDERAWSDVALPDSILNRQVGSIDTSKLAEVVSFDEVRSASAEKKLATEELNLILQRRRANN